MANEHVIGGEAPTGNGTDTETKTGTKEHEVAANGKTKPTRQKVKRKDSWTGTESNALKKKKTGENDESSSGDEENMETDVPRLQALDVALTKKDFLEEVQKLHDKLDKAAVKQDEKMNNMQSEIVKLQEEIIELRREMDQLHVTTRKKNLIFTDIPEDHEEQLGQTYSKVRNIVEHELHLDDEMDTVRRVGGENGIGRRILVTFRSARSAELIMENKHKLRSNKKQKVYINRDDPPRIEQAKAEERKERKISEEYYQKNHPEDQDDEPHDSQGQTRKTTEAWQPNRNP